MKPRTWLLSVLATVACGTRPDPPELIAVGGDVHTSDPSHPVVEAFAVSGGRFTAVGDAEAIRALAGPGTTILELGGATVLPGLIDAHVHFASGLSLMRGVNLYGVAEKEAWLRQIGAKAAELPAGSWIVGGRWDHTLTPDAVLPTKEELDAVTPEHPVALSDVDGHSTWVNSVALELAGVGRETPNPEGGEILRYANGEPSGILLEAAGGLVRSHVPPLSDEERLEALRDTLELAASLGLTGAHDMSTDIEDYAALAERGDLPLRIWFGAYQESPEGVSELAEAREALAARLSDDGRGPRLAVGYVKLVADGVLSTRTAHMLEPYADAPDETGFPVQNAALLNELVAAANELDLPVAIHAIGDRAVRASLDAFEASPARPSLPNRIEHIEVIHPEDAPRFAELGVLASMNPHHCITGIGKYNTARLGDGRAAWSFAWNRLAEAGATLAFGSDWATAPLDPMEQLYAAVVREQPGSDPSVRYHPDNRVSFEQALYAYTQAPADASGWGEQIGSITVGKWADFVVLDGEISRPVDRGILEREVRATYVAGEAVYVRN